MNTVTNNPLGFFKRFCIAIGLCSKFNKNLKQSARDLEDLLPKKSQTDIKIPYGRIIETYDPTKPTIIIIDDSVLLLSLVIEYIAKSGVTEDSYNILKFYGVYAPFILKETLLKLKEKVTDIVINAAIIDIVLPGKIRSGDSYIKMDGIDISILLSRDYGCNNFLFFSGNVLNVYAEYIYEKAEKFKKFFNEELSDYVVNKTKDDKFIISKFSELILKGI